jgi:hypothetical protein
MRHAEILTVLALHDNGVTAERLALELYGERGNPVSARAEVHRLRNHLGHTVVRTRPYRLDAEVDADFRTVDALLREGDLDGALAAWPGPLLPRSVAPTVMAEREDQIAMLRRAVLDQDDAEKLWTFAERLPEHDLEVLETLADRLPDGDVRTPAVLSRLRRALNG